MASGTTIRRLSLAAALVAACLVAPRGGAHPVNMSCVGHRYGLRVTAERVEVEVFLRYFEFPSLTQRLRMDADGNTQIGDDELWAYGQKVTAELAPLLVLEVDGERVALRSGYPPVLDLLGEWRVAPLHHELRAVFSAPLRAAEGQAFRVSFETRALPDNPGFFRFTLAAEGVTVVESSVVERPPMDFDTPFPPDPEERRIEFRCTLGAAEKPAPVEDTPPAPAKPRGRPDTFMVGLRAFQERVAKYFRGDFEIWAFLVLVVAAFAYGGVHALAPGHAKTITAAYLIGAHATAWHAVLLGVVVTVSHTWSIYALAVVTHLFYGGEVRPETHGLVMAASGGLIVVLGLGQFVSRLRGRSLLGHHHHHDGGDHHHDHGHAPHDHHHEHGEPGITMKSLVLLGFSGGIVPCPGALWIYFLALSVHRTAEGIVLIAALGAGLATVLTAIGLVTVRVRRSALSRASGGELRLLSRLPGLGGRVGAAADRALVWLGRRLSLLAPCVIAAVGMLLVFWGLLSAGVIGG